MTLSKTVKATIKHVSRETYDAYATLWKDVIARTPVGAATSAEDYAAIIGALANVDRRLELATVISIHVANNGSSPGLYGTLPDGETVTLGFHSLFKSWLPQKKPKKRAARPKPEPRYPQNVLDAARALGLPPADVAAMLAARAAA